MKKILIIIISAILICLTGLGVIGYYVEKDKAAEKTNVKVEEKVDLIAEEESLMLRGIIDLYFEEDDEIVIVDYKTDYIDEDNKQEVIDRYRKQLDLYAEALNKLTGKKVKEKYLYLFNIDEEVKL